MIIIKIVVACLTAVNMLFAGSLKTENGALVTTYNVVSIGNNDSNIEFFNDMNRSMLILEEAYYKYEFNNNISIAIGKLNFRTNIENNVNPVIGDYSSDGIYLTSKYGYFVNSIGFTKLNMFSNDGIVINEGKGNEFFEQEQSLSIISVYNEGKNKIILNYFYIDGTLNFNSYDIKENLIGLSYTYNDIIKSGYTFYVDAGYSITDVVSPISEKMNFSNITGYAVLIGANKIFEIPYFKRDAVIGTDVYTIKNNYLSLNSAEYISLYTMSNNGTSYSAYTNIDIYNNLELKMMYVKHITDGDICGTNISPKRYNTGYKQTYNSYGIELKYKF